MYSKVYFIIYVYEGGVFLVFVNMIYIHMVFFCKHDLSITCIIYIYIYIKTIYLDMHWQAVDQSPSYVEPIPHLMTTKITPPVGFEDDPLILGVSIIQHMTYDNTWCVV